MSDSKSKRVVWSNKISKAAVNAVLSDRWSTYKTSLQYGVPRKTLINHLKSRVFLKNFRTNAIFTLEKEQDFVSRIIKCFEIRRQI